jgi:hypothetical protein
MTRTGPGVGFLGQVTLCKTPQCRVLGVCQVRRGAASLGYERGAWVTLVDLNSHL